MEIEHRHDDGEIRQPSMKATERRCVRVIADRKRMLDGIGNKAQMRPRRTTQIREDKLCPHDTIIGSKSNAALKRRGGQMQLRRWSG